MKEIFQSTIYLEMVQKATLNNLNIFEYYMNLTPNYCYSLYINMRW